MIIFLFSCIEPKILVSKRSNILIIVKLEKLILFYSVKALNVVLLIFTLKKRTC